VSTALRRR